MGNIRSCVPGSGSKTSKSTNVKNNAELPVLKSVVNPENNIYVGHAEAVILSCFFNPKKSEFRTKAFYKFYETIKHMNHKIVELAIGDDPFQLTDLNENPNILRLRTKTLLFHKEGLLNFLFRNLSNEYQYIFWIDADILFTNNNWITDSVKLMQSGSTILQPFEYCFHLDENETKPSYDIDEAKQQSKSVVLPRNSRKCWRSFAANYADKSTFEDEDYDIHGHVGFAWCATRSVLERTNGLFDKALIGGADHIMAHAAVGQIPHNCINKVYNNNNNDVKKKNSNDNNNENVKHNHNENNEQTLHEVIEWSRKFFESTEGFLLIFF
jgi:hypothetical protein